MTLARSNDRAELVLTEILKLKGVLQSDMLIKATIASVRFATTLHRTAVTSAYAKSFPPVSFFNLSLAYFYLPFLLLSRFYLSQTTPVTRHLLNLNLYFLNLVEQVDHLGQWRYVFWSVLMAKRFYLIVDLLNTRIRSIFTLN